MSIKKLLLAALVMALLSTVSAQQRATELPSMEALRTSMREVAVAPAAARYQDHRFKNKEKGVLTLWPSIPFFAGGDIGQYQTTMAQSRDSVRKDFFNDLIEGLSKLADKGAVAEVMLEPMANILMQFDQLHDIHKAKDVVKIDFSLEHQFKAALDALFVQHDVRDSTRKVQISKGTDADLLQSYIREISADRPFGKRITQEELNVLKALEIYEQIDYLSYGTFSNIGNGNFQVTYHLQGFKNGVTRNFIATGRLTAAVNDLAQQVFDFFQKNEHPDWETPYAKLQWLLMPVNPTRSEAVYGSASYTFDSAKSYCAARGYRLPYSREILMAESGGQYKQGGVQNLESHTPYPVADRRRVNENHVMTPGHEHATGGAVQPSSTQQSQVKFVCVKGAASADVLVFEKLWELHRQWRGNDIEVLAAIETLRFELGDSGTDGPIYFGNSFAPVRRLGGVDEAMQVLRGKGIQFSMPGTPQNDTLNRNAFSKTAAVGSVCRPTQTYNDGSEERRRSSPRRQERGEPPSKGPLPSLPASSLGPECK